MSQLWSCYVADNVERFRRLLALTGHSAQAAAVWNANVGGSVGGGTPGNAVGGAGTGAAGDFGSSSFATSPKTPGGKSRKISGHGPAVGTAKLGASGAIGKSEINSRDHAGLTILLRAAASTSDNALAFVQALLEHPATDIYVQDAESGWNALHRALYAGNISIARLLLERERKDIAGRTLGAPVGRTGQLIKTKDHEGNSPFDLYNSTIGERLLNALDNLDASVAEDSDDDEITLQQNRPKTAGSLQALVDGEDLFFFGSNKNLNLGFGDGDDRQFPERVYLKRPDHLVHRLYEEYLEQTSKTSDTPVVPANDVSDIPALIQGRPLLIHDVVLSKLHSAILTADPVSNLYVCGIGRGGRLGFGDENTRFSFEPVQGPLTEKKIVQVALGQNHSMAVTDTGELWTWGSNAFSQLGYALPPAKRDEDPMSPTPRQVFGPLRKECILGVAASSLHSVAHTGSSLYCWGKNIGQLALMDADSRSLDVQTVPRKVAASLFSSPIVAVSAIDKATTCLLANHTVCVFTSYGYNIVKFPFTETYGPSARLGRFNMASYDPRRSEISYIASGGETIVAATSRGDLFTMNLTNVSDSSQSATSTTNPSKIRGALTQPQCIWTARKDGVRSVDVGEQGSVIISTHSGAVWRRVKRAKAKDAHVSGGAKFDAKKKKDYKFQRVPFITNVATVRSSTFGAFAAIRRDSDVIKQQIGVDEPTLWDDVRPLMMLRDFESSEPRSKDADTLKFWNTDTLRERLGPVAYQILRATELENDMTQYLADWSYRNRGASPLGAVVRTSLSPDIQIPVHSWILSARSSVLRDGLTQCRRGKGSFVLPETLTAEIEKNVDGHVAVLTFSGLDLLSLLNLVLYLYEDKVIPVWNYTRQAPPLAYRYRQVRAEVMKLATRLNMPQLESAVRIQTEPKRSMDRDFRLAMQDSRFFEDGDAILELDGAEVSVHSVLLCQRCPWFQGLFHGRSGGLWLAGRRGTEGTSNKVRLDLKHMVPRAFQYVLQYLYADVGAELFDSMVSPNLETFFDSVLDVLSIANELMLDRLSQICQLVIGQFANTRNVAHLLNTISACSVTEFKDAGLEYICLQMEMMLENHLLDDLDEDLLQELDGVVRDNQLTQMPFAKSGRAELELHQKYPDLAQDIEEERQRRVREMVYKSTQREDDRRVVSASSFKSRIGSIDDIATSLPHSTPERTRRKSRGGRNEPFSPDLRPKASHTDLIFSMEDEDAADLSASPLAGTRPPSSGGINVQDEQDRVAAANSPREHAGLGISSSPSHPRVNIIVSSPPANSAIPANPGASAARPAGRGYVRLGAASAAVATASIAIPSETATPKADNSTRPWGPPAPSSSSKLDLRTIMTETISSPPSTRTSALSAGLDAQRGHEATAPAKAGPSRISQRERKKQQQQQQQQQQQSQGASKNAPKAPAWDTSQGSGDGKRPAAPWQAAQSPVGRDKQPATRLVPPPSSSPTIAVPTGGLPVLLPTEPKLGSTKPSPKKPYHSPRAASPDTRFAGQPRSSGAGVSTSGPSSSSNPAPLVPHSKVYIKPAPKAEPLLGVSMADIIFQQQLEQETIREAVAKRSLQEIQQEQAFQEWWDQESRRTQEEEARRLAREKGREGRGRGGRGAKTNASTGGGAGVPSGGTLADGEEGNRASSRKSKATGSSGHGSKASSGGGGGGGRGHRGGRGGGSGGGGRGDGDEANKGHNANMQATRQHHVEAVGAEGNSSSRRRGRGGKV